MATLQFFGDSSAASCGGAARELPFAALREALAEVPRLRLAAAAAETEKAALHRQLASLEARCAAQQQSIASLEAAAFQAVKVSGVWVK